MIRIDIDYKMEQMDQQIQALTKDIKELHDMMRARAFADGYSKGWKACSEQYERTFEAKYEAYKAEKGLECYYARRTR